MATASMNYAASADITITLASLASSSGRIAGRSSAAISNASNKYIDALVGGKITPGTTPAGGSVIEVWVYAAVDDTPTYPDVIDGTDAADAFGDVYSKVSALRLAKAILPDATSDQTYWIAPFSVAALFDGVMPQHWGIFVTHDTGVALNDTSGNHAFSYTGIKHDVA